MSNGFLKLCEVSPSSVVPNARLMPSPSSTLQGKTNKKHLTHGSDRDMNLHNRRLFFDSSSSSSVFPHSSYHSFTLSFSLGEEVVRHTHTINWTVRTCFLSFLR